MLLSASTLHWPLPISRLDQTAAQCRAIPTGAAVHREGLARSAAAKRGGRKVSRTPRVSPSFHLHPSPLPPRYMIVALAPLPSAIIRTHKRHLHRVRHHRCPLPTASPPALATKLALVSQDGMTAGLTGLQGGEIELCVLNAVDSFRFLKTQNSVMSDSIHFTPSARQS